MSCFEAIKSSVIFLQLCAQFTINNLPLYIFLCHVSEQEKNSFRSLILGKYWFKFTNKIGFICKFEFSDFCIGMAFSVLFRCVTNTYTPSTLWSRCTPITLLNRPHAAYCLVVIYFPHPYPYILLMYLFFLGEEDDKAFFVKPKRFVDETFRTYSSQIN